MTSISTPHVRISAEEAQLAKHERAIRAAQKKGLKSFVEIGHELAAIRDGGSPSQRLYRTTHGTFEEYCQDVWGWSRQHAYRLIESASVYSVLSKLVTKLPSTESQLRELNRCDSPEKAAELWNRIVESKPEKITARLIGEYIDGKHDPLPDSITEAEEDDPTADEDWRKLAIPKLIELVGDDQLGVQRACDIVAVLGAHPDQQEFVLSMWGGAWGKQWYHVRNWLDAFASESESTQTGTDDPAVTPPNPPVGAPDAVKAAATNEGPLRCDPLAQANSAERQGKTQIEKRRDARRKVVVNLERAANALDEYQELVPNRGHGELIKLMQDCITRLWGVGQR